MFRLYFCGNHLVLQSSFSQSLTFKLAELVHAVISFIRAPTYIATTPAPDSKMQTNNDLDSPTTYKIYKLRLLSSFRTDPTFFTSSNNNIVLLVLSLVVIVFVVAVFILPLMALNTSINSLVSFDAMSSQNTRKNKPALVMETCTCKMFLQFSLSLSSNSRQTKKIPAELFIYFKHFQKIICCCYYNYITFLQSKYEKVCKCIAMIG